MALPKLDTPIYETTLISNGKKVRFRPFLVKEQKLFLMASESGDSTEIISIVKQVLNNCLVDEVNIEELPMFDIENLFINLRARSVGEVIDLKYKCNNTIHSEEGEKLCGNLVKIDLNLLEVKPTINEKHSKKIEMTPKLGIMMKYPNIKMINEFQNLDDIGINDFIGIIVKCIDYIYDEEVIYYAKDSSREELTEFVENLKQDDLLKIQNFFTTMPKLKKDLDFKCTKCNYEEKITVEGIQSFFV